MHFACISDGTERTGKVQCSFEYFIFLLMKNKRNLTHSAHMFVKCVTISTFPSELDFKIDGTSERTIKLFFFSRLFVWLNEFAGIAFSFWNDFFFFFCFSLLQIVLLTELYWFRLYCSVRHCFASLGIYLIEIRRKHIITCICRVDGWQLNISRNTQNMWYV